MYKHKTIFPRFGALFLCFCSLFALSSCEEKISGVGSQFLRDTVFVGSSAIGDSALVRSTAISKKTVNALGRNYALNYSSPYLLVGRNADESLECWSVLRSPLIPDSLGTIKTVSIVLPMNNKYLYGNDADQTIDISVYTETGNKATDSAATLTKADLSSQPVGTFTGTVSKDSLPTITITLDSAVVVPLLKTASLSFVIVPNVGMKTMRAFSSLESGLITSTPHFSYTNKKNATDTITSFITSPVYDYHLAIETFTPPPGTFYLRGVVAQRERFVLNTKLIREKLSLDKYATINTATLQLTTDPSFFKTSATPTDTTAPALVTITAPLKADSAQLLQAYGERDTKIINRFNFQLRNLIESALRNGQDSIVFELRSGYTVRTFNGVNIDVEDYNFVRWVFYNVDAADVSKRPRFLITYSHLTK